MKIEPKAIGVGQYQHDVSQKRLEESLTFVVESAVNHVGVDVNTASPSLLSYVSGINSTLAKNIVKYRDENGKFENRQQLQKKSLASAPRRSSSASASCVFRTGLTRSIIRRFIRSRTRWWTGFSRS